MFSISYSHPKFVPFCSNSTIQAHRNVPHI
jgi:hypothetical protein